MNSTLKKAVALLCVLITMSGILALPAAAATYENDLPIVYLVGAVEKVYNKSGKQVWPVTKGIDDILLDNRSELLSAFSTSLMTSDWNTYGNALNTVISKYYSAATLDKNGNPKNGTAIKKSADPKVKKSGYGLGDYRFNYDPRLDLWETAAELKDYINAVLKATGKKKINLVGRCMGASLASAYLCRYGADKVDTVIYLASAAKGSTVCGELFSGRLDFDSDSINSYVTEYLGDDELSELLSGIVNITYSLNMLGMGTDFVAGVFEELSEESFQNILLSTYATMPSYWAMVGEEYYEEAKEFVFGGRENEYAGLIKKIDNYHNKVKVPLESKLKQFKKNGLKIAVIAKYNTPFLPILESHSVQGDGTVSLEDISFGATGAKIGETLSADYMNSVKDKGKGKYISEDLIVDASTCLFPNNTWFIRDIEHGNTPTAINNLMLSILRSKSQATVNSFSDYPQFTAYNSQTGTLEPITEPIANTSTLSQSSPLYKLITLFTSMAKVIKTLFSMLLNGGN